MPQKTDEKFMRLALNLAEKVKGNVSPDPSVGAVIVKNGKVISRGYHDKFASPHAEEYAIKKAGVKAKGATLYINLEPCCHFGNNPPCTDNIIKSGIKKVVAAIHDPNPLICGKGFKLLKKAGVDVTYGVLGKEAAKLNEAFIKHITTRRPFVILKYAMSVDGKIATKSGESRWISSRLSRDYVHKMRSNTDAVMVGIGTILKDDPMLTARGKNNKKNPIKIILDTSCKIPLTAKALNNNLSRTILVVGNSASAKKTEKIKKMGVEIIQSKFKKGMIDLNSLTKKLGSMNITSIMIEGGGRVASSALEEGIVDKILAFISPMIIGGEKSPTPVEGKGIDSLNHAIRLKDVAINKFGDDIMIEGYIKGE